MTVGRAFWGGVLLLATSFPGWAEEAKRADAADSGIVIVNGKKFFPLNKARRFVGGGTPSGLLVQHQARAHQTVRANELPRANMAAAPPAKPSPSSVKPLALTPPEGMTPPPAPLTSESAGREVLSLFAPDEKAGTK